MHQIKNPYSPIVPSAWTLVPRYLWSLKVSTAYLIYQGHHTLGDCYSIQPYRHIRSSCWASNPYRNFWHSTLIIPLKVNLANQLTSQKFSETCTTTIIIPFCKYLFFISNHSCCTNTLTSSVKQNHEMKASALCSSYFAGLVFYRGKFSIQLDY
jgi:hypothetical protein